MRAGIVWAVAFIGGCAWTTAAIGPGDKPTPKYAYLYGRFFIRADEQEGSFVGHQQIVLQVWCRDERRYNIAFSTRRDDIQVLEVHPSSCALIGGIFTDQNGIARQSPGVEPAKMVFHEFAAGRAYYLGDYFARAVFSLTTHGSYNELFWSWAMDPAEGRYEGTTADMKAKFPYLAALPTADKQLIPAKPAPKRGAVVITDPNDPPMTPERIARVAPFIKRTFPSPAACEAACPKGQCLPFRGEAGAAMTCVVRCNTDADCPDGLSCNCPNNDKPEGPGCQPIATIPGDRMARVCLSVEGPPPAAN